MLPARDRLIVALDVPTASGAQATVRELGSLVSTFKVGLQLFTAAGPAFVRDLVAAGHKIFLDLKFHDIPNTVAHAVGSAADLGVSMLTVHASGGAKMLEAAAKAAADTKSRPLVLAVTVLTSLSDEDLQKTGVAGRALDHVLRLASLAQAASCGGVVASPNEVRALRRELGEGFAIVTPGVRPAGSEPGDQARTATAGEAVASGATYVVVGRPILEAKRPKEAAEALLREIEDALAKQPTRA
ncbi:MAG: orotidine-5'-phosphate decarboxylase [Acidobacteriales bacterium]|nr:orotidine-5'-phosphate decarboxylase [Terriglobales bacterium]